MMPVLDGNGQRLPRGLTRRLLDLFSSVWLGVLLATLLFVYCSVGSALPSVRKHPLLELTEFEWFHWWPFNLLILLFCANLCIVTVRRIPLRAVNAGVWMIHTGIILLAIGSFYYFGTKVEGDAAVFRREVQIKVPNGNHAATLVALPGSELSMHVDDGAWHFRIDSTNPAWPILSDEHKGETAYAVNVTVTPPVGEPFIRQLLDGYPQYTEDVLPGQGRAIKALGRKLVEPDLTLTLDLHPTEYFHVMDSRALFVRRPGDRQWIERPIHGLPRYHEHVAARDQVFTDRRDTLPVRPLDLEVPCGPDADALRDTPVRITGYLPYAQTRRQWRDGGGMLNPVLRFTLSTDHTQPQAFELMALDRRLSLAGNGLARFRWLDDPAAARALEPGRQAMLRIEVPGTETKLEIPLNAETVAGAGGDFKSIEGIPYKYRVLAVHDDLTIPSTGGMVSVVMLELQTPDGTFTRMVADQPALTRDMHDDDTTDPHGGDVRSPGSSDPRIVTTYKPSTAPLVFVAHPDGLDLVYSGPAGRKLVEPLKVGEKADIADGVSVRVDALLSHARAEVRPFVVPRQARREDVGPGYSTIRLEIDTGQGLESRWLPYHHYALPDANYAYGGRFAFQPEVLRLADGTLIEVLFSRERRRLPNAVALEDFQLDTHVGGYTGSASTIRNYVSNLRFGDAEGWTEPRIVKVNAPTEDGGYWYFQSTWDRPTGGESIGGMNYTGLGVGNRNGVWVQLAGCALSVIGMLFAFYVKPMLKRRRAAQARARIGSPHPEDGSAFVSAATPEAEPVLAGAEPGVTMQTDEPDLTP